MQKKQPLILTLRLDDQSKAFFDTQRKLYFPPDRNFLQAHLTIFHQLPDVEDTHDWLTNLQYSSFPILVTGLMNLGAGVAYKIDSEALQVLHKQLSDHFSDILISQDRQSYRPHITILNKSTPEKARALHTILSESFQPFTCTTVGLDLWTYMDGPWRFERSVYFQP